MNITKIAAAIVVLAIASTPALAFKKPDQRGAGQLPPHILGSWCLDLDLSKDGHQAYYRPSRRKCEDIGPTIRPDGYSYVWDECKFTQVTQDATGYLTITKCDALSEDTGRQNGISWTNKEHYRMNKDGYLVVDISELSHSR
jgi:hypothetical protein